MTQFWHTIKIEDVLLKLKTNLNGLTQKEAERRLKEFGHNKLEEKAGDSPFKIFFNQFKDFLIVILLLATIISFALGETVDAIIIFTIVLFSAILGFVQEYRSQKAVKALKKLAAPEAMVLRDDRAHKFPSETVVPGDVLLLAIGDKVAADARIIEEMGLEINESALTGESLPVKKENSVLKNENISLGDRKNMLYAGTIVTRGHARGTVVATGMHTEFGKIAKMIDEVKSEKTPLEKKLEKVGQVLGIASLGVCASASLLGVLRGYPLLEMFLWGVSLAVAAVPEALPAVVTGALSLGVWEMAKKKAIVRRLPAVETLGSVSVICSDKTGTLTRNEMTVREVLVDNKTIFVEGSGYAPEGGFLLEKGDFIWQKDEAFKKLVQIGLLCNDATLSQKDKEWQITGDPTEGALVVLAAKVGFWQEEFNMKLPRISEVGFDASRKRMSTIHSPRKGKYLIAVKGAPENVLPCCVKIQKNEEIRKLNTKEVKEFLEKTERMAEQGLRVLAIAYKEVDSQIFPKNLEKLEVDDVENDLVFLGLVGMIDPPREEAKDAVRSCFLAGIRPIIVTGDHAKTTLNIGRQIGLFKDDEETQVIEGAHLDKMTDAELYKIIENRSYVRVSPAHKLRIVKLLQKKGFIVAMTGDGVNDAPAIKQADIGVAMGISGTDVAKEASAMILADDNFATIVSAVEKGREIYDNIKKYLFYLLRCNIGEILVLGGGFLLGFPPILSAVQILWINLVTDGLPALALGVDLPDKDIMKRKPITADQGLFSFKSIVSVIVLALSMAIILLSQFSFFIQKNGLIKVQTIIFITMVLMEMVNAYNSRSESSALKSNPFSNKWLNLAVMNSILMTFLIVQVPWLSKFFGTVALGANEWLMALAVSFSALVVSEIVKLFFKRS